jgi:hypothetical protein
MAMIGRAVRAWGLSVLGCVALLFLWGLARHALLGRWDSAWRTALDVSLAFGSVFAVVAATLHLPMFLILTIFAPQRITRTVAVTVGTALAPVVYLAIAMAFNESDGPRDVFEWMRYWGRHPGGLLAGVVPFALAGAVYGFAWVWPAMERPDRRVEPTGSETELR